MMPKRQTVFDFVFVFETYGAWQPWKNIVKETDIEASTSKPKDNSSKKKV